MKVCDPMKKIIVIGAGAGGLAAAMILSARGYEVEVFERDGHIGGRARTLDLDGHRFDVGATFLTGDAPIKAVFAAAGEVLENHVTLQPIDPLYEFIFKDGNLKPTTDQTLMRKELERAFPRHVVDYFDFIDRQKAKFQALAPLSRTTFHTPLNYLRLSVLKTWWHKDSRQSVFKRLNRMFADETFAHIMSFQTKYLGMSPHEAPAYYTFLSYLEFANGLYRVKGGLGNLFEAMRKVIEIYGGKVHLKTPVKRLLIHDRHVHGIVLEDDSYRSADIVINSADFGHFIKQLVPPKHQRKYKTKIIDAQDRSLSAFVMYLGLDKTYNLEPHTLILADNMDEYYRVLMKEHQIPDHFTVYIHNPSAIDSSLTDEPNHSSLYILLSVPNTTHPIDWEKATPALREAVFKRIKERTHLHDLQKHIVVEKTLTPIDWERDFALEKGAVFGLSHTRNQTLYRRPHNRFNDIKNVYLVGSDTHPGSSIMQVFQSALLTTRLITKN